MNVAKTGVTLATALFLVAGPAAAAQQGVSRAGQEPGVAGGNDAGGSPQNWGGTSLSVHTVNSWEFTAFDSTTVDIGDGQNGRFVVSGGTCFEAPVLLPTGSIIDHVELEACDTGAASVDGLLFICNETACTSTGYPAATAGTPGCVRVSSPPGTTVVANGAEMYTYQVCTGTTGNTARFKGVRFFYRLQVSPAPATATFGDVPTTHPAFRFVEALAASGITGGCGGGNYCPDNPLTRGQMAIFLAAALGLHFPN